MSTQEEVPAVCETCLGPNPYLQMLRERRGLECKLCTRPFTVYKWAPVKNGPFKNTIICLTCAKQRNCCQSCLLDLTYGIPIQLRDAALKMAGVEGLTGASEPKNEISKLYVANNSEKFQSIGGASVTSNKEKAKEILEKLALVRGDKAPKSQVKRKESSLVPSHLDKIDVTKIVSKLPFNGSLNIPEDKDLKTLFIFGIDDSLPEYKITDFFEKFGKVKSFNCQHKAKCGFITFTRRVDAEAASKAIPTPVEGQSGLLVVESIPLRVTWGRERTMGNTSAEKLKVGTIVTKFMKKLAKSGVKTIESAPKKKEAATLRQIPDYEKVFRDYEF